LLDALKRSEQGRVVTISSKGLIAHPFLKVDLDDPEFERRKFSVQKAYYQSKLAQVMYTYWLAGRLQDTPVTANSIRVTNVRIDIDARYPTSSKLMKRLYAIKSSFSITPEQMAETYTYLATSDEVRTTSGKYYDDPTHIVNSSGYSRDPENIEKLMDLTLSYFETAASESSS
jgi:NAD(P)-dependent dehydrogenase (short-subunit alcohol dehydrogenase family)